MPRAKFQTLTEQMFYILLCLHTECCGIDIMQQVDNLTEGHVKIGPGTLYNLLGQFSDAGMIRETKAEGHRKTYILTEKGKSCLQTDYRRLKRLTADYLTFFPKEGL